ncbi:MAG: VOC family protein [Candidatus Binatia bacterium]
MIRPRKVGHVVLKVRDIKRAEQFYTEVLGFEVVTRLKRPRGVFFSLGEQHHDIAVLEVPSDADVVKENQVGLHHVALQVGSFAELQECYRTLKAHDVTITATIDHSITKSIYFLDPDGNGFELYCDVGEDGLERIRRGDAAAFAPLQFDA